MDHEETSIKPGELRGAPTQWRSLEELDDSETFRRFVEDEFPHRASLLEISLNLDRRQFLTLMGASLGLAGLAGCSKFPALPDERIVPAVRAPEEYVPGKPLNYATAVPYKGYALGALVESHEGRPTKIEGNDLHPATLGSSNVPMQAALLQLYDPDRSTAVSSSGDVGTWDAFVDSARTMLDSLRGSGAGLRILTETVTSPTLASQIAEVLSAFPGAVWHQYDAVSRSNTYAGAAAAFGRPLNPIYHFDRATVILSLDSDFLYDEPGSIAYARQFIDARRVRARQQVMNRLYTAEAMPTITGAMADHRFPMKPSVVEQFARAVASRLGVGGSVGAAGAPGIEETHLNALIQDLQGARGKSIVIAGEQQPPAVHAMAHAINQFLGNNGTTVTFTAPVETHEVAGSASLERLVEDCRNDQVKLLLVVGGNPALTAPADIPVAEAFAKVPFTARLGLYQDETSALCQWHIPESHFLEAWSDIRGYDGTVTIVQPLIQPLYDSRSAHELMAALMTQPLRGYEIVRGYWEKTAPGGDFEKRWRTWLNDGVVSGTTMAPVAVAANAAAVTAQATPAAAEGIELNVRPDPYILDGRYSNNAWLQELPNPLTKLVWDNAAIMSGQTAVRMGYGSEDRPDKAVGQMVELEIEGRKASLPIFIIPGHAHDVVTVHLGFGRGELAGQTARDKGFDVRHLRTAAAPWFASGLQVRRGAGTYELVSTHYHNSMDMQNRDPVVVKTLKQFQGEPHYTREIVTEYNAVKGKDGLSNPIQTSFPRPQHGADPAISLYETPEDFRTHDGYQWAMSIDNNACIGCNACVIACQAENNTPVVGKQQVSVNREMHWLRVDRYYDKPADDKGRGAMLRFMENPKTFFQPVPCMHCEKAPCEPVCPVNATLHSHEGLNQMVYNRCVGTRYCSNNCPYKVRRFNFLNYANHHDVPVLKLLNNPNVTVRGRGVMEKCTYCVQRINAARIEAKKDGKQIADGQVVTACQQACPTRAIIFGNLADENSAVRKLKTESSDYSLLADLNTRPRTTYLPRFRNPNEAIEPPAAAEGHAPAEGGH